MIACHCCTEAASMQLVPESGASAPERLMPYMALKTSAAPSDTPWDLPPALAVCRSCLQVPFPLRTDVPSSHECLIAWCGPEQRLPSPLIHTQIFSWPWHCVSIASMHCNSESHDASAARLMLTAQESMFFMRYTSTRRPMQVYMISAERWCALRSTTC